MYNTYRCVLTNDEAWQDLRGRLISLETDLAIQDVRSYEKINPKELTRKAQFIDLLLVDMERLASKIAELNASI
jgi:uncharacterized coiled-coil protein SlyX